MLPPIHSVESRKSSFPITPLSSGQVASGLCPHGAPQGMCPICLGMGGGGGGGSTAAKPRPAGLMTWNEAFAVWHGIQLAQQRQADFVKSDIQLAQQNHSQANAALFTNVLRTLLTTAFARRLNTAAQTFFTGFSIRVLQLTTGLVNALQKTVQTVRNIFQSPLAHWAAVGEKLNAILGDTYRRIEEIIHANRQALEHILLNIRQQLFLTLVPQVFKRTRDAWRRTRQRMAKVLLGLFGLDSESDEDSKKT